MILEEGAKPLFDSRFYLPLKVISILKGEGEERGFVSPRHSNGLDYLERGGRVLRGG